MYDIETICSNSYRNFHTKGFDYLCLSRTPELTRKVYFFDGELSKLPELVMPHNHRYNFTTTVLSGAVANKTFRRVSPFNPLYRGLVGQVYDRFSYLTPLNGGDGFSWEAEDYLLPIIPDRYRRGEAYRSAQHDIHTLDIRCEGTIILLEQEEDLLPIDEPTKAWRKAGDKKPPNLSGLYDRMTPDHARLRINQFLDAIGNRR